MVRMCVVGTHVHRRPTWKVDLLAVVELDRIVLQGDQFVATDAPGNSAAWLPDSLAPSKRAGCRETLDNRLVASCAPASAARRESRKLGRVEGRGPLVESVESWRFDLREMDDLGLI